MRRFIELTTDADGQKILVNPDSIEEVIDCGSLGAVVFFRNHSEEVEESYETIKELVRGESMPQEKITVNDLIAAREAALENVHCQARKNCNGCPYFNRGNCEYAIIVDYINGEVNGNG